MPHCPVRFGGDPVVQAAWLYYAEQRTQAEISTALGVSRATVANHLAQARRSGLVTVTLDRDLLRGVRQAQELETAFGLAGAYVIPDPPDGDDTAPARRRRLGKAGATVLMTMIDDRSVLGVAWGRTMADLATALPERRLSGMRVVQISGSSLGDEATSPEACTITIATRLAARCHNFHAPAVVSTPDLQALLMREVLLAQHFRRLQSCTVVVFGVGDFTATTRWADGEPMIRPVAETYRALGGTAILIGRFIDRNGRAVAGPLSGRQIGMELDALRRIETRLCVAGGVEKAAAIRAALAGGFVTHLVTDAATATLLLAG